MSRLTVQRAHREHFFADQGIEQRRLTGTDAAECREVQVPVLQLVEHCLDGFVVVRQRLANALRKARIVDQLAQAFAREFEVPRSVAGPGVSRRPLLFLPAPSWQRGERPLQYFH